MLAILFLMFGILFSVLLWKAVASGEILARGWGFNVRMYSRYDEPVRYWITFVTYLIIVIWMIGFAAISAFGVL
ncbi:MAG: hypothetical protein WBQ23_07825 [Bacteroidota bacterium]